MAPPPPVYDLVILLDPSVEEDARRKLIADVEAAVRAGGELLRHDTWGDRTLAYPIDHRTDAEYHLLQMHATPPLLEQLHHTLHLSDDVVRFRIIKLAPGTPDAPDMRSARRAEPEAEPVAAVAAVPSAESADTTE